MASFASNSTIVKLSRSVTRQNEKAERVAREQQDVRFGRNAGKRSQFQVNMAKVRGRKDIPDEPETARHPSPPGVTAEELLEEYTNRDTAHRFKISQRIDPEVLNKNLTQQKHLQLQKLQGQILERSAQPQDLSNIMKKLWLMRNSHDRAKKQKTRDLDKLSDRCKRKLEDMRKHLEVLRMRKQREDMLEHDLSELSDTNSKWQRQIDEFKQKKTSETIIDLTNNYRKIMTSKNTARGYRDAAERQAPRDELIFARDPRYAGSVASCLLVSAGMEVHQETRITKIERRRFFVDELRSGINSLVASNSVHGREWKFYKNMIALLDERVAEARQFMEERCVKIVTHMREKSDVMAKQLCRFDNERDLLILFQRQIQTDMLAVSHKQSDFLKNFSDLIQELAAKVGFFEARQLFIRDKPSAKLMRRLNSLPAHILQAGAASLGPGHPKNTTDVEGGGGDAGAKAGSESLGASASATGVDVGESVSAMDVTKDGKKRKSRKFSLRRSRDRSKSKNRKQSKSRSTSRLRKLLSFGRKSKSRSKSRKSRDKTRSNSKRRRKFVPSFKLPSLSRKRGKKGASKDKRKPDSVADADVSFTPSTTPAPSTDGDTTDGEGSKKRFRRKKSKSKKLKKPKKEKPMKIKKITVKIDKHRKQLAKNHIVPLEYEIYDDKEEDPPLDGPSQLQFPSSTRIAGDPNFSAPTSMRSNSAKGSASARSILIEPDDDRADDPLMRDEMKLVDGRTDFNRLRRLHRIRTQAVQKLLKRIELNGVYMLRNVERVMLLACFLTETPSEDAEGTPVQDLHARWAMLVDPAELKMITGASVFVKERDTIQ